MQERTTPSQPVQDKPFLARNLSTDVSRLREVHDSMRCEMEELMRMTNKGAHSSGFVDPEHVRALSVATQNLRDLIDCCESTKPPSHC